MIREKLTGVGVAMITPFTSDGRVDYQALARMIDYVIEGGVDYIVALGTTAETPTLYMPERAVIAMFITNHIAGRVPLVMGCGGNSTSEVLDQLREFDLRGADAILSVTPYYNKPSQEGLYQHFRIVSEHSPLPVILYNIPGRSGVNMTAETTLRLARDMKNVIGIKEASGDIEQMQRILDNRPEGFLVLSGDDGMTPKPDAPRRRRRDFGGGERISQTFHAVRRSCQAGRFRPRRRGVQGARRSGARALRGGESRGCEMRALGDGQNRPHDAAAAGRGFAGAARKVQPADCGIRFALIPR